MAMQLLELLVVFLRMFLLRRRFVGLIISVASLTDKAALLRHVYWVTFAYVGECMFWNANLLTLMLLAARGEEIERWALIVRIVPRAA